MPDILVHCYSRYGAAAGMANHVARGIEKVDGMHARLRTVPAVAPETQAGQNSDRPLTADEKELRQALGERLASVTHQLQPKD